MTFSADKLRITSAGGSGTGLPSIIYCGELVDPYLELDVMILQDVSGSYGTAQSIPFVKSIANCILTAWPNCRLGLSYFADYPINPYGGSNDVPYSEQLPLAVRDFNNISTWTLPALYGADEYESQLDAIQRGALSETFGWRPVVPYRKRIIVLNTDTYPHENDGTHISKQTCVNACIANNVWPIYVLTSDYYFYPGTTYTAYDLGYGVSGFGDPADQGTLISQILTGIYKGVVQ